MLGWVQKGLLLAVAVVLVLGNTACSQASVNGQLVQPIANRLPQIEASDRFAPALETLQHKTVLTLEALDHRVGRAAEQTASLVKSAKVALDDLNQTAAGFLEQTLDDTQD